jgi:hypothetical protein
MPCGRLGHQRVDLDLAVFQAGFRFMDSNPGAEVLDVGTGACFGKKDRIGGSGDDCSQVRHRSCRYRVH